MRRKATFKHIRSGEFGGRTILLTPVITTSHKGFREVGDDLAHDFSGGGRGHAHLVGKPSHCVGVDNLVGPPIDAGLASVALKVGTNIPVIDAGGGPSGVLAELLVYDYMCFKRGNGVSVVIIGTIQAGPCRMFGVETRGSK